MRIWLPIIVGGGCSTQGVVSHVPEAPPLALTVDSPIHGAFVGDGPAVVSGSVTDPTATVWVEGVEVAVAPDGSFTTDVDVDGAWRMLDIEVQRAVAEPGDVDEALVLARTSRLQRLVERRAVFAGVDPMTGWPGALSLRLTPDGLDGLAASLALQVDAMDLPSLMISWVPSFDVLGFGFAPRTGRSMPARASLDPSTDGLAVVITLEQLELGFDLSNPLTGDVFVVLGTEEATLGAGVELGLDQAGGLMVGITDTQLDLGRPVLQVGSLDPSLLEVLTEPVVDLVVGALEGVLDLGALLLPDLGVGQPLVFEADLLGTPLALSLGGLGTDDDGLGARLDVDLGAPATEESRVPTAAEAQGADLAVALHEGLIQGLLAGDLLSLLDLDLRLDGVLGEIVALPLANLPGGEQLPADRTGFCLSIDPGQLRVARLEPGLSPLGQLILPEVTLDVGVSVPGLDCGDWLEASLGIEALLDATDGTHIGFDLVVADGAVLSYAAEGEHDEAAIIAGLGGLVDSAMALLGGTLSLDLTDLLGGASAGLPLPDLAPRLLDAEPVLDDEGLALPGLVIVTLDLFD